MIETPGNLSVCTSLCDTQEVTLRDLHLQELEAYVIKGSSHKRENMVQDIQSYWPIRHELDIIDGVAVEGKQVIIPFLL